MFEKDKNSCLIVVAFLLSLASTHILSQNLVTFKSNNEKLNESVQWAITKALSYVHDDSDPVGYWYEAALPNREAFCMRDVSHQAIGAEILGLGKHNFNMFLKFAKNISKEKDYCSYWEINRYDLPAPVDYENDKDFWYNLPANFDVIYNAYRLYKWTGNEDYLNHPDLLNFYKLSLEKYIDHWDLGSEEIIGRKRSMHLREDKKNSRFGNKRGIPTYNEGGRGETILGIDLTASIIAAYKSFEEIARVSGNMIAVDKYREKAVKEREFLEDFWWDKKEKAFRSIQYADRTFDYFMVGNNQAFLHYLLYFNVLEKDEKIKKIVEKYIANYDNLIVELKSYLPIIYYENGYNHIATKMVIELCNPNNQRRDYPENSFTIIEHVTRGLMGINADATNKTVSTFPRLDNDDSWAEINNVPLLTNKIAVVHTGNISTTFINLSGNIIKWTPCLPGKHNYLYINGKKIEAAHSFKNGEVYSYISIDVVEGEEKFVSVKK